MRSLIAVVAVLTTLVAAGCASTSKRVPSNVNFGKSTNDVCTGRNATGCTSGAN